MKLIIEKRTWYPWGRLETVPNHHAAWRSRKWRPVRVPDSSQRNRSPRRHRSLFSTGSIDHSSLPWKRKIVYPLALRKRGLQHTIRIPREKIFSRCRYVKNRIERKWNRPSIDRLRSSTNRNLVSVFGVFCFRRDSRRFVNEEEEE